MSKITAIAKFFYDFWRSMNATDWLPWVYLLALVSFVLAVVLGSAWLYVTVACLMYSTVVVEIDRN